MTDPWARFWRRTGVVVWLLVLLLWLLVLSSPLVLAQTAAADGSALPSWLQTVLGAVGAGVAVYAGIRADLAALHEKAANAAERADSAHDRIDRLLLKPRRED